jgi:hypothetical protein
MSDESTAVVARTWIVMSFASVGFLIGGSLAMAFALPPDSESGLSLVALVPIWAMCGAFGLGAIGFGTAFAFFPVQFFDAEVRRRPSFNEKRSPPSDVGGRRRQ